MTRPRMFAIFLGLALGGAGLVAALFAGVWRAPGPALRAVTVVHLMPVLLATLAIQGPVLKQPILEPLGLRGRPNRWWLLAWLAPVLVLGIALLVQAILDWTIAMDAESYAAAKRAALPPSERAGFDLRLAQTPPIHPGYYVIQALPAGVTLNLLLALATELGWRGFLFREVQGGFWRRAFYIGWAEAAFLVPIAALGWSFPTRPFAGALLVWAWCMVASPVLVYFRARSASVLAVAAFRGTLWSLAAVAVDLGPQAGELARPFFGWTGLVGMAVLLGILVGYDRWVADIKLTGKTATKTRAHAATVEVPPPGTQHSAPATE